MADYSEMFNQYIGNRFGGMSDAMSDPMAYLQNRVGINTATNAQPQTEPVQAPINPALAPQAGPTITAAQGQQPLNSLNQVKPVAAPMPQAGGQPEAPVAPVAPVGNAPAPMAAPAPRAPIVPSEQPAMAPPAPAPIATPAAAPAPINAPAPAPQTTSGFGIKLPQGFTDQHYNDLNSEDPKKLMQLAYDPTTPPSVQRDALDRLHADIDYRNKVNKAETLGNQYLQNGDVNGITREINKKGDEGSYIKAYLFARLGLTDLAQQEQEKISPTKTTMPIMIGNEHYSATYSKNGELLSARNEQGDQVDNKTLAKIAANGFAAKGATTGQSFLKDPEGNVWSHTVTPGTNHIVWTNQTTGEVSSTAPAGATPFGQVNPVTKANIAIVQAKIKKMESDNIEAARTNSTPPHSQSEIDALKETMGAVGATPGAATPGATASAPGASPKVSSSQINNNPGNIMYGPKAIAMGATDKAPNGTAIFPNMAAGDKAQDDLLSSKAYANMNLHQIVSKWAPNNENNPAQYAKTVKNMLGGIDMEKTYNELTPAEKQTFRESQYKMEHGGTAAEAKPVTPTSATKWSTPEANEIASRNPTAESIADYKTKPPAASGRSGASAAALMNDVRKINPDYDETKYQTAQQLRTDYAKGNGAKQVTAINRALPHLDYLDELGKNLNNTNSPIFNKLVNEYKINTGQAAPTTFNAVKNEVVNEVNKAIAGSAGALADREALRHDLNSASSPAQLENVIKGYKVLIAEQSNGLKQNWTSNGLPEKEYDNKLLPRANEVINSVNKRQNNTRSKW